MKCINCGRELSEKDFCTSCGADVRIYKRVIKISNMYYNDGLAKASVRDLSGAIVSLRQSLRFNKENIKARNLLGLVYYETGEVVSALSEWVISKNFQGNKNIADDYIKAIQSNPNRLDTINQTIKKYNQALIYCKQDSEDLAIIQLKKVFSLNPNLIRAHQLIALLYMRTEEYDKARKELLKAAKIDTNNTTTLRYLKELDRIAASQISVQQQVKTRKREDKITYQSGNETIIQPTTFKENNGLSTVLNIIIGIVIGVAATWFLILPARVQQVKSESAQTLTEFTEQITSKDTQISGLQTQLDEVTKSLEAAEKKLGSYEGDDGKIQIYETILDAYELYNSNDMVAALEKLSLLDEDTVKALKGGAKTMYDSMKESVETEAIDSLYQTGYTAYKDEDYEKAIDNLTIVVSIDEKYSNSLYLLGKAYQLSGDQETANEHFNKVIELFPGTEVAGYAEMNLR